MKTEDLDRILLSEEPLVPSSGFVASVMSRVQQEASVPEQIPFPWRRFTLSALLLSLVAGWFGATEASQQLQSWTGQGLTACFQAFFDPVIQTAVLSVSLSLTGSAVLLWIAFRLADAHR
jgi:hypothetical protein